MIEELHDMGVSYDEAFDQFKATIEDARREWAATILRSYPFKMGLDVVAEALRKDLHAHEVEVNSISSKTQTTVAKAPSLEVARVIPVRNSLCVMSVGTGVPEQVSDIHHDPFMIGHAALKRPDLGSWCSVPLKIAGTDAGAVCALQEEPRVWNDHERELLEAVADKIGTLVTDWASEANLSQIL